MIYLHHLFFQVGGVMDQNRGKPQAQKLDINHPHHFKVKPPKPPLKREKKCLYTEIYIMIIELAQLAVHVSFSLVVHITYTYHHFVISCCNRVIFLDVAIFPTCMSFVLVIGSVQCSTLQSTQIGRTSSCAHTPLVLCC